jgi:NAD(P)-dependent dehydrogenase (short-subunit alcohol dehydrogenase family)
MSPVALVTGASSGIGRALAARLARDGYAVALAARRAEALSRAAAEIDEDGGRALPLPTDVSLRASVQQAVQRCEAELGPIDLLVANAGVTARNRPGDPDWVDDVERVLRTNYLGAVYATGAVLPGMLARRAGHLVGIGSVAGFRGLPRSAAYTASKAALANYFESLRIDLRGTGVAVTLIRPGYVRTPLTDRQDHPMPFMMDLDAAVERMMRAIRARRRSALFPRVWGGAAWISQLLPDVVYDWIGSKVPRGGGSSSGDPGGGGTD